MLVGGTPCPMTFTITFTRLSGFSSVGCRESTRSARDSAMGAAADSISPLLRKNVEEDERVAGVRRLGAALALLGGAALN